MVQAHQIVITHQVAEEVVQLLSELMLEMDLIQVMQLLEVLVEQVQLRVFQVVQLVTLEAAAEAAVVTYLLTQTVVLVELRHKVVAQELEQEILLYLQVLLVLQTLAAEAAAVALIQVD